MIQDKGCHRQTMSREEILVMWPRWRGGLWGVLGRRCHGRTFWACACLALQQWHDSLGLGPPKWATPVHVHPPETFSRTWNTLGCQLKSNRSEKTEGKQQNKGTHLKKHTFTECAPFRKIWGENHNRTKPQKGQLRQRGIRNSWSSNPDNPTSSFACGAKLHPWVFIADMTFRVTYQQEPVQGFLFEDSEPFILGKCCFQETQIRRPHGSKRRDFLAVLGHCLQSDITTLSGNETALLANIR